LSLAPLRHLFWILPAAATLLWAASSAAQGEGSGSAAFADLQEELMAGRYRSVWSAAQNSTQSDVLALGADAAASEAFCSGYGEEGRPLIDQAMELSERAVDSDPEGTEGWLQFARAKSSWLQRYAFTPELLEVCVEGISSFVRLLKLPQLLSIKEEAAKVSEAFNEALRLEPDNGVALVGLGATELLEPLHPCVDAYEQQNAEAALQRIKRGLETEDMGQLKSFIAADALQEARDTYQLPEDLIRRQGLELEALWRRAAEPCEEAAYCQCLAAEARSRLNDVGAD